MNFSSLTRRGERHPNARFNMPQIREFRRRYFEDGETIRRLAADARCAYTTMRRIIIGRSYREPDSGQ